jgi:hypothetical protein
MFEAMGSKVWVHCHHLHTKFYPSSPIGSKIIRGFPCIHHGILNICHFGMVEATGLKNVASRSPSMASPVYQIS